MDLSLGATHDMATKRTRKESSDSGSPMKGLPPAPHVVVVPDLNRCLSDPAADRMVMDEGLVVGSESQNNALDLTAHPDVEPASVNVGPISFNSMAMVKISDIEFKKVLDDNPKHKTISYEGQFLGQPAVVVLEKTSMSEGDVKAVHRDCHDVMTRDMNNDIYGKYLLNAPSTVSGLRVTVIHPATTKHIEKYSKKSVRIVEESPEDYVSKTLPTISTSFNLDWVYNFLDHKSEVERIIFEDADPEVGFMMVPDFKWDQKEVSDLYLLAVVKKRGITSLRDLRASHIPLLENVYQKGVQAIEAKYGLVKSQLRVYVHYRPSYYHFHVHFTNAAYEAPGAMTERAHMLTTVINNLKMAGNYYELATLAFPVYDNDPLYNVYIR